tara:strand:+ start:8097 stop:8354 length:258 start_codon:yes stop_codon:yes gene_type:complete
MKPFGFSCGPFLSASAKIEEIGYNLYFSYLYSETIKEHQQLQIQLDKAKEDDNSEALKALENEICYLEGTYRLSMHVAPGHEQEN